ncbi:hypothetical protein N9D37_01385 [Erythrobacter sp.]|nr:hypothetical protein [Erythrobacter sp.]
MNTILNAHACARAAMTRALSAEMGVEENTTITAGSLFCAVDGVTDRTFAGLACLAEESSRDMVVSMWESCDSKVPACLVVAFRTPAGVEMAPVHPASLRDDKALVLISGDRRSIFALNDKHQLFRRPCSPSASIERAVKRGQARLAAAIG